MFDCRPTLPETNPHLVVESSESVLTVSGKQTPVGRSFRRVSRPIHYSQSLCLKM